MLTYKIYSINDTRYLAKVEIYTSIRSLGSPSLALPFGSPTWLSHLALPLGSPSGRAVTEGD